MSDIVQPLGSRVLVRIEPEENVTRSGLFVPDTEIRIESEEHLIIESADLLAILRGKPAAAAA
jgi:co-chaperonin GroES (HSP10)